MLKNNCQCELCRSVWGEPERKEPAELTRVEAAIVASFVSPYPAVLTLNPAKIEAMYENNR